MSRKIIKIVSILVLVLYLLMIFNCSFAVTVTKFSGKENIDQSDEGKAIAKITSSVLRVIRDAGIAIALVILTVISIKYLLAAPGERADIKQNIITYVIGAMVFLGASGIVSILYNFSTEATKAG